MQPPLTKGHELQRAWPEIAPVRASHRAASGRHADKGVFKNRLHRDSLVLQDNLKRSLPPQIGVRRVQPHPDSLSSAEEFMEKFQRSLYGPECVLYGLSRWVAMNRSIPQTDSIGEPLERNSNVISDLLSVDTSVFSMQVWKNNSEATASQDRSKLL